MSVQNVFAVESKAIPSLDDIKKLPNKVLLWCGKDSKSMITSLPFSNLVRLVIGVFFLIGSRSSNLLRHLYKGFLPAVCSLPVPGYMVMKSALLTVFCPRCLDHNVFCGVLLFSLEER